MKFTIYIITFICFNFQLFAVRTGSKLSLDECIEYAQEHSPEAIIAKQNYLSRKANIKAFRANYLPQVSMSMSVPGLVREINEITQPDGTQLFLPQSQLFSSGSLNLEQQIPWTGATISASSVITRLDLLETNFLNWRTSPFQIGIIQPLFRPNNMKWDIEIQELREKMIDNQYSEEMEQIAINVANSFFSTYISEMNVRNAQLNLSLSDTLFTLAQGRLEVGRIDSNDYLQTELNVLNSGNNLEIAKLQYQENFELLLNSMGIKNSDRFDIIPPKPLPFKNINHQKAIDEAFANRSSIINDEINLKSSERDLAVEKAESGINATLSASYGLNQSASNFNDAYTELLDRERLDLSLQIPIFNWGRNEAQIESAMASYQSTKIEVEDSREELNISIKYEALRFNRLQKQVELSAKADTIAARSFEIAKKRYLIGKIDLNTFFISQREKDSALQSYISTLREYWVSYYSLRRLTLYDFFDESKIKHDF